MKVEGGISVVFPDDDSLVVYPDGTTVKREGPNISITFQPEVDKKPDGGPPKPVPEEVFLVLRPLIPPTFRGDHAYFSDNDYISELEGNAPVLPGGEDGPHKNYEVACGLLYNNNWEPKGAARVLLQIDDRLRQGVFFEQMTKSEKDVNAGILGVEISKYYPYKWRKKHAAALSGGNT